MKRPTTLILRALMQDASLHLGLSVERDVETILRRFEHEGFSFLAITLPQLSDALEKGIEAGTFSCPTSFSRHGRLPRLLGGFFKRVFDNDGRLLPNACPYVIAGIRQICRFFKKPKMSCSEGRQTDAIRHFLEVEGELRRMTSQVERKDILLDKISGIIWAQVFPELDVLDLVCHHGPGFTADRRLPNERYRISKWNDRSELTYPSDLHCYPNYGAAATVGQTGGCIVASEEPEYLSIRDELPVRVVFVPKTLTTPRVIAIEPSHVQYMQQSLKDYVYGRLEDHSLTKHSIRFTDQSVNQRLAYSSSIDKRLATLDLKDASDRVHLHLVQRIFKTSGILEYLEDARSLHATLPNGRNIVLFKYASQGSALCFPVEAMVFYTLIQTAMHQHDGRRPSSRSVREYSRQIAVYGDDIIVPTQYTDVVVSYLESYALKVNISKSFSKSNFRESCGADFYKGVPVNPVYARKELHDSSRHWGAEEVLSWNATADLFYMKGWWTVAQAIRDQLSRVVRRTIPKTKQIGSGLAHFSYLYTTHLRWNADLQGWKQKRLHYDPIKRKDNIDGYELACLNKWGISTWRRNRLSRNRFGRNPYRLASGDLQGSDRFGIRGDNGVSRLDEQLVSARDSFARVFALSTSDEEGKRFDDLLLPIVAEGGDVASCLSTRSEVEDSSRDYCLVGEIQSDPLLHLCGDSSGLDFSASTNRGRFKSKSRWVSLAS